MWSLLWIVTFKYIVFILLADNNGEGGTFALTGLLLGKRSNLKYGREIIVFAGIFGASFIMGDGALTPAISVLAAVEGLAVYDQALNNYIVLVTCIILIILFLCQVI